jgi:hypothetical protein
MKRLALIKLTLLFFIMKSEGQNLVPNPDFENHMDCSTIYLYNATPWCSAAGGFNSAYYNSCESDPFFSTPTQTTTGNPCFRSYQVPRSGVAYIDMGSFVMNPTQERVYPQVKLIDTLEAGKIYCVTYYVSVYNNARYTIDKLGALLTPTPFPCFVAGGPTVAIVGNYTPQVVSTPSIALGDTIGWTEVSGSFTAIGNEAHLAIGDFFPNAQHYILNKYPTNCNGLALYYVDDVSLEVVEIAKTKNDTLIMQGDSIIIGANNSEAALFSWQPSAGLSCTSCPNPKASPTITTTYTVTKTQCKSTTTDVITVSVSPTGIRDLNYNQIQAKLFPNPNNGTFTLAYDLKTNAKANVLIMDVTGKVVYSSAVDNVNNRKQINTEYLHGGIYFIQLADDEKLLWTDKLIISK